MKITIPYTSVSRTELSEFKRFFDAYIDAALWSSNDADDRPLDEEHDKSDVDMSALRQMRKDCHNFLRQAESLIRQHDNSIENFGRAGHDFWLTRNGHGSGFWDGDWDDQGDALDKIAKRFKPVDLYVGDDGKIYS